MAALYGLIDGADGVNEIINILNSELYTAMINGGFRSLRDFTNKYMNKKSFTIIPAEEDPKE